MNLARKLRPKVFDDLVGQSLVKSMLKNGLFLDQVFPVYLFSGQRGCGKTTVARIFAASLNCLKLLDFRADPNISIPCLTCASCQAMNAGSHPDFFELDAASNNGVDNVRQIIETAFYQPVLGMKRIFLLDEAHMLSKAAFNALLKILEEPPAHVVFILATTELDKVPLTIRSRAFLGLFPSLQPQEVFAFIENVCRQENISFENDGLWALVRLSQGCLRDSLNLLEQVASLGMVVNSALVEKTFFHTSVQDVLQVCEFIFKQDMHSLKKFLSSDSFGLYSTSSFFETLLRVLGYVLSSKIEVVISAAEVYGCEDRLKYLGTLVSQEYLQSAMRYLWDNQRTFSIVVQKQFFLDFLLTQLCSNFFLTNLSATKTQNQGGSSSVVEKRTSYNESFVEKKSSSEALPKRVNEKRDNSIISDEMVLWQRFLGCAEIKKESLLASVLGTVSKIDVVPGEKKVIAFSARVNKFVLSVLADFQPIIKSILPQVFPGCESITLQLIEAGVRASYPKDKEGSVADNSKNRLQAAPKIPFVKKNTSGYNLKDKEKWPNLNLLLEKFPGKVKVLQEES